jgi:hypothetical protein
MAMTTCRQCGQEVAVAAKTCPGCGESRPGLTPEETKRRAAASLAFNAGCLILLGLFVLMALVLIFAIALG